MRRILRISALALAVCSLFSWLLLGANRGWTKTNVPVPKKDPVTDLDYVVWEKRFVPGVELLSVGLGGAVMLFVVSLFVKRQKKIPNEK